VKQGAVARAAVIVAAFSLLSRILGLIREAVLSRVFGTTGTGGAQADAYTNSLFIVNTVAAILLYALVTIVIPAFEHERRDRGEKSAWSLLWTISTWVSLGLIAAGAFMALWPEALTALFQMNPESSQVMTELVRIMSAGLALQGLSALLTAVLQSQRRFVGPAAVGVAFNLGIIAGLAIGGGTIRAASWGVVAGAAAQVLLQLPQLIMVLRKAPGGGFRFHHPRLRQITILAIPVIAASVLQQINGYTDKLFAGLLDEEGRVAALNWANQAGQAPRAMLLVPLLTPLFPAIARLVAQDQRTETARAFRRAADVMGLVSLPMTVLLLVYSNEISRVMFGGSQCGPDCVSDIAGPLRFYALGTWAAFIGYLHNRMLSAMNQTRAIMNATIITVVATVALDAALIGPMGLPGLALATSIGVILNTIITGWMVRRNLAELDLHDLALEQGRIAVAAAAGGIAALAVNPFIDTGHDGTLVDTLVLVSVKSLIGLLVFIVVAKLLAPVALREGAQAMRSVIGRRR